MTWQMNSKFILASKARSFAKEAQDDKHAVILNEVKNLSRRSK